MTNQISILQQTELFGQQFSVYGTPETPLFKARDIAEILQIKNARDMVSRVDAEELRKLNLRSQAGETWFLTEDGLYEVLMQSRKPIAKQFKKGVKTILKEIRNNGGYIAAQPEEDEASIMARALLVAQRTIDRGKQKLIEAQNVIAQQEATITKQAPKVAFANAMLASNTSCLIGELAKVLTQSGYTIGQNRLFSYLREEGYLCKSGERYNQPQQKYIEQGLFEIKHSTRSGHDGVQHITNTTKVTPKGQQYFINKFLDNDIAV